MTAQAARKDRDLIRGQMAAAKARAAGASPMDCAFAALDAAFGMSAVHNRKKRQAERLIKFGPADHSVRAEYGSIARDLPDTLSGALAAIDLALGLSWQPLGATRVYRLKVARLALRFARRHGHAASFKAMRDAVATPLNRPVTFCITATDPCGAASVVPVSRYVEAAE